MAACFFVQKGMEVNSSNNFLRSHAHPILCVADGQLSANLVTAAVRLAGCEPVTVADWNEAIALFYVDRQIEAVVLDYRGKEGAGLCLAQALRSLRADVPVVLVSAKNIDGRPKGIDSCISVNQNTDELVRLLQVLVGQPSSATA